ncbi:5-formyltetrahydrofolate cyclo-ligase [Ruixingdingia sedimenti]|uniref:5-formyltetrahydrofolate cyclo-ligase n=1 Tax=Ruixingdingia sedimenti TaxID=3073604 RepID=A0ABU1FCM4_9RHOB|nr:5-formyltetrahydrofolate cyclo-ligase [Xinfangfangia sp. LG-4]MDR5654642.1 5-formyltetrahydrofolate cyclo-ligase [Xinfangfangia sp. LG-4]
MTGGGAPRGYASPPCLAGEIAPDYFDPLAVDAQQATDVARWRKARRADLLAARAALSVAERRAAAEGIARHLDALLARIAPDLRGVVVAGYWPIRAEPDLRPWLARLHDRGARIALPVAERPARPMTFRPWTPGAAMERGHWNIPVPATAETLTPAILIAPLVGWDSAGYRLGHGGGYYDRTLAALRPRPFAIGTGLDAAALPTIFPQPHDVPMDAIVTENGLRFRAE